MKPLERVVQLVEEKIADTDLFIVEVKSLPTNKIQIILDGDKGVPIEQCAAVSRHVGFHLEEENVFSTAYTLEVCSFGVGSPLKLTRQFVNNIGRNVEVKCKDGRKLEGKMLFASDKEIQLEHQQKVKGKKAQTITTNLAMEDINELIILVSFK